jgi:hypothetical protein
MIKVKILKVAENNIREQNVLIIICTVIDIMSNSLINPDSNEYVFVFGINSTISKKIQNNPLNNIEIYLNDYCLKEIRFDEIDQKFGYFHYDLLEEIDRLKKKENLDEGKLINSINECVLHCHTDMYFYFLINVVLFRESGLFNLTVFDRKIFVEKYLNILSVISMEVFKIKYEEYDMLLDSEILYAKRNYIDAIEYGKELINTVYLYIDNNVSDEIASTLDSDDFKPKYMQEVIMTSIQIVKRRIKNNISSSEYFDHEISITKNGTEIKIFPTFHGFRQRSYILELSKDGLLQDRLCKYLNDNKITRIGDLNFTNKLDSKWVFKHDNILLPFFVNLSNSKNVSKFNLQNRKSIFTSIFKQGQLNISLLNLDN